MCVQTPQFPIKHFARNTALLLATERSSWCAFDLRHSIHAILPYSSSAVLLNSVIPQFYTILLLLYSHSALLFYLISLHYTPFYSITPYSTAAILPFKVADCKLASLLSIVLITMQLYCSAASFIVHSIRPCVSVQLYCSAASFIVHSIRPCVSVQLYCSAASFIVHSIRPCVSCSESVQLVYCMRGSL